MNIVQTPIITIGIPCFNQAHYLVECLDSLLESNYTNWEAIVVDDASTEGDVAAVVNGYHDPRIRVIRHEVNRGLAAARNTAFAAGIANLLLPLDADDCLVAQFLSKTVDVLGKNTEVDCVFTDFLLFGSETGIWYQSVRETREMLRGQTIPGAGTLMRRKVWEQVGGYCEDQMLRMGNEDWDFWLACSSGKLIARHVPEPLYLYRRTAGSLSASLRYNDIATREFMYRRHKQLFDRLDAGPAFLSEGCLRTALVAKARHEWRYALKMAARAYHLSPEPMRTLKSVVKGCTPYPILRGYSFGKRLIQIPSQTTKRLILGMRYRFQGGRKAYWEHRAEDIDQKWGKATNDYDTIRAVITRVKPGRILDVGCGSGRLFPLYLECGVSSILGQDVSAAALRLARSAHNDPRIELMEKPLLAMDLHDGYCDLCVSNRVLQHIPENEIDATVARLCSWSQWVYICEIASEDLLGKKSSFYMFAYNYSELFSRHGFYIVDRGRSGVLPWFLFGKSKLVRHSSAVLTESQLIQKISLKSSSFNTRPMKVLIGGLPYFAKKLVKNLSDFDKDNSYLYLEPCISFYSKIRTVFKFIPADIIYFIWGTIEANKLTDLALFMKKKVVMHWVGTDVTNAVTYYKNHSIKKRYIENITHFCEVSWIQDELKQIGIYAKIVQIATFDSKVSELKKLPTDFSILSYVGEGREEFYGINKLIQLAIDFPGIEIKITGIAHYKKPLPENIKLLGWVKNMFEQYNNCVLYLRLPEHDGLAFSVLEALASGRYVGYSCNFENTIFINTYTRLKEVVRNFYDEFNNGLLGINFSGVEFIKGHFNRDTVLEALIKKLAE